MNKSGRIIRAARWSVDEQSIRSVRNSVFVVEQNVPEERDFDGLDVSCCHALAFAGDLAVATGRMEPDGHIGRIAVIRSHRGCGIGSAIVKFFVDMAARKKISPVYLNAQMTAVGFYEKLGFRKRGGVFMDAGIEHIRMERESESGSRGFFSPSPHTTRASGSALGGSQSHPGRSRDLNDQP